MINSVIIVRQHKPVRSFSIKVDRKMDGMVEGKKTSDNGTGNFQIYGDTQVVGTFYNGIGVKGSYTLLGCRY